MLPPSFLPPAPLRAEASGESPSAPLGLAPEGLVLVTGATGFVGAELVRQLLAEGRRVRVLRRPTSSLDLLGASAEAVEHAWGDVTDADSLNRATEGVHAVYHMAAFVGFGGRRDGPRLHAVNARGTAHVVNAALRAGVPRLVHTSSIAALGRTSRPGGTLDETAEWTPSRANSAYAQSKHAAELEVQRGVAEGLDAVTVNPALIFGPGRSGEGTFAIAEKLAAGTLPASPSGGTCVVDVADVAAGLRAAMARGLAGERYVLGGENLRWTEILSTLAHALGVPPPRRVAPPALSLALARVAEGWAALARSRPLLTRETARTSAQFYRYSNEKAVRELGLTFRPFAETAQRLAGALR